MYKDLNHLNQMELEAFMEKYYSKDISVKDLCREYQIKISPSKIYKLFPPIVLKDRLCPYCSIAMQTNRDSKSSYLYGYSRGVAYCPRCHHKDSQWCYCDCCEQTRKEKILKKQEAIHKLYSSINEKIQPISIESFSLPQRLYYGSIFKNFTSENLKSLNIDLAYQPKNIQNIVMEMLDNHTLLIDPNSNHDHFNLDLSHKMEQLTLIPNIESKQDNSNAVLEMIYPNFSYDFIKDKVIPVWEKICIDKCQTLLVDYLSEYGLSFSPGTKTLTLIKNMIKETSVMRLSYIFRISAKQVASLILKGRLSKKIAVNYSIKICENYFNRSIQENWNISQRIIECNIFENFLFFNILKVGNNGFNLIPNLDSLTNSQI